MMSIFSVGSPRRRRTSATHSAVVVPGSTRQSSPASATDGMTLIFGGSPTPDRNHVSEIVDCWIAFVNLFFAKAPTFAFIMSRTVGSRDVDAGAVAVDPNNRANALTRRSFG